MKDLVICDIETELRHRQTFRIHLLVPNHAHLRANNPEVNHQRLKHFHNQTCQNDLIPRTPQVPVSPLSFATSVNPWSNHQALTSSTVRQSGKTVKHLEEVTDSNGYPFLQDRVRTKAEHRP